MGSHDNSISFVSQRAFCLLDLLELFVWHAGDVADQAKSLLPFGIPLKAASMSAIRWNQFYYHTLSSTGRESMHYILVVWPQPNPYPKYTACRYSRLTHAVLLLLHRKWQTIPFHTVL